MTPISFICNVQETIVAFGKNSMGKSPDYSQIYQADIEAANKSAKLGQDQLDWSKQQFDKVWPYAQQYMSQQASSSADEAEFAKQQRDFYTSTYQPLESKFAREAQDYANPQRMEQRAGAAMTDVTNQFEASRQQASANLESYGIDPSQTRYGAMDLSSRVAQAAATAAAGNQSRLNTEATGLALEGEAINIGRGYPGAVAGSYSAATNAGSAGIGAGNQTNLSGSSMMGTPYQYMGLQQGSLAGGANALNMGFQNSLAQHKYNSDQSTQFWSGAGKLIGGALSLF